MLVPLWKRIQRGRFKPEPEGLVMTICDIMEDSYLSLKLKNSSNPLKDHHLCSIQVAVCTVSCSAPRAPFGVTYKLPIQRNDIYIIIIISMGGILEESLSHQVQPPCIR